MNIQEIIESLGDKYDTDALELDYQNGNFNLDDWGDDWEYLVIRYYTPNIVANSWINGQRKQARDQFARYGLTAKDLTGYLLSIEIIELTC